MPKLDQDYLASQLRRKSIIPKGSTDIVMDRLFPERRSEVTVDDERKQAVYVILVQVGALQAEGDTSEQDRRNESGEREATPGTEAADWEHLSSLSEEASSAENEDRIPW